MSVDHLFDRREDGEPDPSGMVGAGWSAPWRVHLRRVLAGLRHLQGSPEPGRVFSELVAVCVPAFCDEMTIDVSEAGMHPYRIRRPAPSATGPAGGRVGRPANGRSWYRAAGGGHRILGHRDGGFTALRRRGLHRQSGRYLGQRIHPTEADATMLEVLNHAGAVVHRERTIRGLTDPATVRHVGSALGDAQRIAASAGVLMALHHLNPAQARHLLTRAGDRTDQSLLHTADTVLHTGALPGSWLAPVDTEKQPEPS